MPSPNNGNTCWANRRSFCLFGEYVIDDLFERITTENDSAQKAPRSTRASDSGYVMGNPLMGYPPISHNSVKTENTMDTEDCGLISSEDHDQLRQNRKRQSQDQFGENVKRSRQHSKFNIGLYPNRLMKQINEETVDLKMEDIL